MVGDSFTLLTATGTINGWLRFRDCGDMYQLEYTADAVIAHVTGIVYPGDFNCDGCVDQSDLGILLAAFNKDNGGDIDGDGDTDQGGPRRVAQPLRRRLLKSLNRCDHPCASIAPAAGARLGWRPRLRPGPAAAPEWPLPESPSAAGNEVQSTRTSPVQCGRRTSDLDVARSNTPHTEERTMTRMHQTGWNLALLAGLAMGANALAGERCDPEWDVTLGNPGMTGGYVAAFAAHDDGSGGGEQLYATGSLHQRRRRQYL